MGTCLNSRNTLEERQLNEHIQKGMQERASVSSVSSDSFYRLIDFWLNQMPNLFTILTNDIINIIHSYWHTPPFYNNMCIYVLLLGPCSSGKTTTLKQIQLKYSKQGISEETVDSFTAYTKETVIRNAKTLCKQSNILFNGNNMPFQSSQFEDIRQDVLEITDHTPLTPELGQKIKVIWDEPIIQRTWQHRHEYQSHPNTDFFMNKIMEIAANDYKISEEDYIKIRMRTTGFCEEHFDVETECGGSRFVFVDCTCAGARGGRAKILNMSTDNVKSVIYHVAISEYNIMCFEDSSTLRLHDAINFFKVLIDHQFIRHGIKLILLFTHYDLFKEQIKRIPITVAYHDFPINEMDPIQFVLDKFRECLIDKNIEFEDIGLEWYCVNVTDTDEIGRVLDHITRDLVSSELKQIGF